VARGAALYQTASCSACHGSDARGTPLGPDLSSSRPLWGDGSVASIRAVITSGVAEPRQYRQAMPAMGGSQLSAEQVGDLAAWIAALRTSPRPH
jgi:mono/diheme cytochrome c family protein